METNKSSNIQSESAKPEYSESMNSKTLTGEAVSLADMLGCREHRAELQKQLLNKYHSNLISFCMNIPGPIKTNDSIRKAFDSGVTAIINALCENNFDILDSIQIHAKTGDELFLCVKNIHVDTIKDLMTDIEETHTLGRLFDIDVLDSDGNKLSRKTYRKCFICGCQAQECASRRKHSVAELQSYIANKL